MTDQDEYSFEYVDGILQVRNVPGYELRGDKAVTKVERISEACADHHCQAVLVVSPNCRSFMSDSDIFELGRAMSNSGLRFAMVIGHDATEQEEYFLENVVQNRGGTIRFFETEEPALAWLRASVA